MRKSFKRQLLVLFLVLGMATPLQAGFYYCDADGDGHYTDEMEDFCTGSGCEPAECHLDPGDDCHDGDPAIYPGAAELCDGLDNDCDEEVDEELTRGTSCGIGPCAGNTGTETCTAGTWGGDTCDPYAGASVEGPYGDASCSDGIDNDCDESTDDGDADCEEPCLPTGPEVCDNTDNDCDGLIDEELSRGTSCGTGACAGNTGTETCTAGTWGGDTCDPYAGAAIEGPYDDDTCSDGIDNDCDESTDDGDADCEEVCLPTGPEVCDNTDNDCDGLIDEELSRGTSCGVGVCAGNTGTETCTAGTWGGNTCDPLAGAKAEACNNTDDDCDGLIDEELSRGTSCGTGVCAGNTGTETCTAGTWGGDTCDPLAGAKAEACNNTDDDCDGLIDEALSRGTSCGSGACAGSTGTETCTAGTWGGDTCDPYAGASIEGPYDDDTCSDGIDNDCDKSMDDGDADCEEPCFSTGPEVCDNADNDCDGLVDENCLLRVTSLVPEDEQTGVSIGTEINIVFSTPLDTVRTDLSTVVSVQDSRGMRLNGTGEWNHSTNQLTFIFEEDLSVNAEYRVMLSEDVYDLDGNRLDPRSLLELAGGDSVLSFVTESDGDHLSDDQEKILGTDPENPDSDGDTIPDDVEVGGDIWNPLNTDSDEWIDALDLDSDGDGSEDSHEFARDLNGNGLSDHLEGSCVSGFETAILLDGPPGGCLREVSLISAEIFPESGRPNVNFIYGLLEFKITGLTPGEEVRLLLIFPDVVPVNSLYFKYRGAAGWQAYENVSGIEDGDNEIVVTLTDGGDGDDDGIADGTIIDPSGVGVLLPSEPLPPPPDTDEIIIAEGGGSSSGGGCSMTVSDVQVDSGWVFIFILLVWLRFKRIRRTAS